MMMMTKMMMAQRNGRPAGDIAYIKFMLFMAALM